MGSNVEAGGGAVVAVRALEPLLLALAVDQGISRGCTAGAVVPLALPPPGGLAVVVALVPAVVVVVDDGVTLWRRDHSGLDGGPPLDSWKVVIWESSIRTLFLLFHELQE